MWRLFETMISVSVPLRDSDHHRAPAVHPVPRWRQLPGFDDDVRKGSPGSSSIPPHGTEQCDRRHRDHRGAGAHRTAPRQRQRLDLHLLRRGCGCGRLRRRPDDHLGTRPPRSAKARTGWSSRRSRWRTRHHGQPGGDPTDSYAEDTGTQLQAGTRPTCSTASRAPATQRDPAVRWGRLRGGPVQLFLGHRRDPGRIRNRCSPSTEDLRSPGRPGPGLDDRQPDRLQGAGIEPATTLDEAYQQRATAERPARACT